MLSDSFFDYELLDFGYGRRLERFGEVILDRESPFAGPEPPAYPERWKLAAARFDVGAARSGRWIDTVMYESPSKAARDESKSIPPMPECWTIGREPMRFELRRSPFGHLGIFPEQIPVWHRISSFVHQRLSEHLIAKPYDSEQEPLRILNLFAYTGGSTLAAVAAVHSMFSANSPDYYAQVQVTHLDAAANVTARARQNATISGLSDAKIRWISEDVQKFISREIQRGRVYDAIVLDPPTYGHGRRGETWRIANDLPRLLKMCAELTRWRPKLIVLSAHTPGFEAKRLGEMLCEAWDIRLNASVDSKTAAPSFSPVFGRSGNRDHVCDRGVDESDDNVSSGSTRLVSHMRRSGSIGTSTGRLTGTLETGSLRIFRSANRDSGVAQHGCGHPAASLDCGEIAIWET